MKKDENSLLKFKDDFEEGPVLDEGENENKEEENKGESEEISKVKYNDPKKYKDLSGLTIRKLNIGLWYVENKKILRRVFIGFLLFVAGISWTYTIYGFARYIAVGMKEDEELSRQIVETGWLSHEIIKLSAPKVLAIDKVNVVDSTGKRYDYYVKVKNSNENSWARFNYYFTAGDIVSETKKGFILPSETKYLVSLSNELERRPGSVNLNLVNFKWIRVDKHKIPDWNDFKNVRMNLEIKNTKFIPEEANDSPDKIKINNLTFTAINNSVYNYWKSDFIILLYNNFNVIGVNKYTIEEFMSDEARDVSMSWPGNIRNVNKIDIIPEVDIVDEENYIKYKGGIGEEK